MQLAAYVVLQGDQIEDQLAAALQQHCQQFLSPAAVPTFILSVAALPLLPSGKVDHSQLSKPAALTDGKHGHILPGDQFSFVWMFALRSPP